MNKFIEWLKENYTTQELENISEHGCSCGINGLIYYTETCAIYEQYCNDIWDVVRDYADSAGFQTVLRFLCEIQSHKRIEDHSTFCNEMVWLATEIIANEILDEKEAKYETI